MGSHVYPQAGAGPSSYYQQSPPPHHVYGNHSPGPRPNYHYSYPVPPLHLNSHQPPQFQQSPSRANHRHNVGGGGTSRGTHHYNNYHPTQHHQHHQFLQSHVSPQLGPHPQQQQQQHIPYSPQSTKYNHTQPYSPSYHYPSPTAPVFTPSWQTQQPLSPLPKQLSMPPPQMPPPQIVQVFYESPPASPPESTQSPQMPVVSIVPSSEDEIKTEHAWPTVTVPVAQWAIWSRRPQDPSHAPSIIISPRARPPLDVIQQALDLKTPPQSQPSSPSRPVTVLPAVMEGPQMELNEETASSSPFVVSSSASDVSTIQISTLTPPAGAQPAQPAPTASKKSWADLLRPPTSSTPSSSASPSSGSTTRNTLPTSSVVGFSIPAGSASASSSSNPTVPVSPSEKSELIALLTTGPSPNSVTTGINIRPRGIVNSGNMCYANSVLQVLAYCLPFQRLFIELGKVLAGTTLVDSGAGSLVNGIESASSSTSVSGSTSTLVNGLNGKEKEVTGMTPLVDATIEFLGEFVDDKKTKSKAKKQGHSKKGSVHVNGSGGTSGSKGKEKDIKGLQNGSADDGSEVDWDACDSFLPTYVYDAMKSKKRFDHMKGGHQEDAEEFFGFYLETLEEELLSLLHAVNPPKSTETAAAVEEKEEAAPPEDDGWMEVGKRNRTVITRMIKATESPITRIFSGRFRTTVRAPGQKDSATVDDWNLLRLDIQRDHIHTIQDALASISHPQSVQLTQSARPGIIIEGQQQSLIEVLPPILVLQMKRFGYGSTGVAKVGKQVRFGPELEIGPDLMVPAAKKAHSQKYKLFGALHHHGLSASGGHYTLDVLHPNRYPGSVNAKTREGWVRIDDELVSDVRHEDVFGAYERDDARCAYLLFYRRI